jgi:hypothetical protein
MAEIPIEKKSGFNWLWLLLAAIVLALLAWWLLDDDGDVVEYTDNDTAAVVADDTMVAATPVVGMMAIGDTVNLDNVRVTSLAGDMAFNVDANGQNMLVLFDQTPTPNTATEGEYDINVGSMVNLDGEVRSAADALPTGITAEIPAGTDRYIYATDIEMVK